MGVLAPNVLHNNVKINPREARGLSMGIELVLSVLLGLYVGRWFDQRYGTKWIALVGIFLGTAAGFRSLYQYLRVVEKQRQAEIQAEEQAEARESARRKENEAKNAQAISTEEEPSSFSDREDT